MKKLDRLILKSFLGPLALTFTISVFVLLMQFVWKYVDDLVGKGLDFGIIAELLFYASATFVPMALPIAVLFASIMTMGNFGEKYELIAMKAGGISIRRVMRPMVFIAILLTGIAFYFANNIMPIATLKYKTTLYDVTRKKPALNIRPSEYYDEIDGYVIRVNKKDSDGLLHDIIIYDHTDAYGKNNVIVAKNGYMQTSPDNQYLIFTLHDGYTYMEDATVENFYTRPFTSIEFEEQVITFDISSFAFNKSDQEFFSGSYQMMNVAQLDTSIQKLEEQREIRYHECANTIISKLKCYQIYKNPQINNSYIDDIDPIITKQDSAKKDLYSTLYPQTTKQKQNISIQAEYVASQNIADAKMYKQIFRSDDEYINRHYIEKQRKYTLSIACLLLFLIGAPFGSIVRKGGLGMPLVASVGFFVLYYVIGMIAEKAVRGGALGPIGMWFSTFAFLPIGIFLTVYATTDSSIFSLTFWKNLFHRWRGKE